MANTYQWVVTNMDCYPTYENQTDVVFQAYYYVEAFSSETHPVVQANGSITQNPYQATLANTQSFTYTAGSPYTPYDQLTNDIVVGWIQDALGNAGVQSVYTTLDTDIAHQINPPVVNPPLPWSA